MSAERLDSRLLSHTWVFDERKGLDAEGRLGLAAAGAAGAAAAVAAVPTAAAGDWRLGSPAHNERACCHWRAWTHSEQDGRRLVDLRKVERAPGSVPLTLAN